MTTIIKKRTLYILIATISVITLIVGVLFVLEKAGITNFYTVGSGSQANVNTINNGDNKSANPPNTVDYSVAKPEDSVPIEDKNPSQPTRVATNPELAVVITNPRPSGSQFLIKAVISGTDSATCSATMTKGSLSATASSGASIIEAQYSCKDLSIPMSQLPESGDWNLQVTVTDKTGATASTSQDVKL